MKLGTGSDAVLTTNRMIALQLAEALEREVRDRVDEPEGAATMTMSVTFVREIIKALRGGED